MTAIIGWIMSKFGLYGLLAILLVYGANKGYEHYNSLTESVSSLTSDVKTKDAKITELGTSITQAVNVNSSLKSDLELLRQTYSAISKANDDLREEKGKLQASLSSKEKQLQERFNANVENDQCVNADMPDYLTRMLDDAEREARASADYYRDKNNHGKSAGKLDGTLRSADQAITELGRIRTAEYFALLSNSTMQCGTGQNTALLLGQYTF